MTGRKRIYCIVGLVAVLALVGTGATMASGVVTSGGASGQIDDGAELLDQASITLEQAIAAAQAAYGGAVGEIDLEMYQGRLVFNVDVGDRDVKVDAENGAVLGYEADDGQDEGADND
jgi:uncharacterized membrane protein YkoI